MRCCQHPDCPKGQAWDALSAHVAQCLSCGPNTVSLHQEVCAAYSALRLAYSGLTCRYLRHPDPAERSGT